jgi:hypothetical protein
MIPKYFCNSSRFIRKLPLWNTNLGISPKNPTRRPALPLARHDPLR